MYYCPRCWAELSGPGESCPACRQSPPGDEDFVGQDWYDTFVPERVREAIRAAHRNYLAGGPVGEVADYPVITRHGDERMIHWHRAIVPDVKAGERVLGIGDVNIRGQDPSNPAIVLRNVPKPEEVYETLRRAWLESRKRHGLQFREYM